MGHSKQAKYGITFNSGGFANVSQSIFPGIARLSVLSLVVCQTRGLRWPTFEQ